MDKSSDKIALIKPDLSVGGFSKAEIELMVESTAHTGIETVGQAIMIFQKAKELGIGAANAITHMHVVNGKSGIDIHIIKALLSRPSAGISWELVDDYKPTYNYTDGLASYTYTSLPKNYIIISGIKGHDEEIELQKSKGFHAVAIVPTAVKSGNNTLLKHVPIDYATTYKIKRLRKRLDEGWETLESVHTFMWTDALAAQLPTDKAGIFNPNSNWQKYRRLMMGIRSFTYAARDIASDLLLGVYESTELYDMTGQDYTIDEQGRTTVVNKENEGKTTILK